MKEFESWWTIPKWGLTICLPPRCGSSTVLHHLVDNNIFAFRTRRESGKRIMVVRDPVDRFKSLWKHKCRDEMGLWVSPPVGYNEENNHMLDGLTPEELITLIEQDENPDGHWATLKEIEAGHATHVIQLKDLSEFLDLPHVDVKINETDGDVPMDEETEKRVKAHYAEDYEYF